MPDPDRFSLQPDVAADWVSVVAVRKNGDGSWPDRPTSDPAVTVLWLGADPGPEMVTTPAVSGMYATDARMTGVGSSDPDDARFDAIEGRLTTTEGVATSAKTKADAAATSVYVVDRTAISGTARILHAHHGSGSSLPAAANVKPGDTFIHTALGPLVSFNGSWRQADGSPKDVADKAARDALVTTYGTLVHNGYRVRYDDRVWQYDGAAWDLIEGRAEVKIRGSNAGPLPQADAVWANWGTTLVDTDGMWSTANNGKITIPAGMTGQWRISVNWIVGGTTANTTSFFFRVIKGVNQTSPPTNTVHNVGGLTSNIYPNGSITLGCTAGDVFTFQYWTNQASLYGGGSSFGEPSTIHFEYLGK